MDSQPRDLPPSFYTGTVYKLLPRPPRAFDNDDELHDLNYGRLIRCKLQALPAPSGPSQIWRIARKLVHNLPRVDPYF